MNCLRPSASHHCRLSRLVRGTCFVALLGILTFMLPTVSAGTDREPGPGEEGLRLRLTVEPRTEADQEGFDVRIELMNASDRTITLRADWTDNDAGDMEDYLEAATSMECVPAIAPWIGGVRIGRRTLPQPERALQAGDTLSVRWQTDGRKLKNRVTNPNEVQNPTFPFPGLYSVHANIDVITSKGTFRLRSNEQLVSVGGSHAAPKHTFGQLLSVDPENKTAVVGLGALHKIEPGDQFEIGHPKGLHWKLSVTNVKPDVAFGTLELLTQSTYPPFRELPHRYMPAKLISDVKGEE